MKKNNLWKVIPLLLVISQSSGQTTSQLVSAQCGEFMVLTGNFEFETVSQAQDYKLKLTNVGGAYYDQTVASGGPNFIPVDNFTELESERVYRAEVQVKINGSWGSYGPDCLISTLPFLEPILDPDQCGQEVNLEGNFEFEPIYYAEDYQISIRERVGDPFFYGWATSFGPYNYIAKSRFPGLQEGRVYRVKVKIKVSGVWGEYGPECLISINSNANNRMVREAHLGTPPIVNLFPNPSNEKGFNVNLKNLEDSNKPIAIQIYDIYGREVYSWLGAYAGSDFNITINQEGSLGKGAYIVRISVGTTLYNRRIVVN